MANLIESQLSDALAYAKALRQANENIPDEPEWGGGLHLILPDVIPLKSDFKGDEVVYAWLVANDFNGYDLSTDNPAD
jgi:hypothetical protein